MRNLFLSLLFITPAFAIYKGEEETGHKGYSRYSMNGELDKKHYCSATLVAPDIFISTAWCVLKARDQTWIYRTKTGEKIELKVVHSITHPQFDPSKGSWGTRNIGVFRLDKPVPDAFGDLYKTIPTETIDAGVSVTIAGFGRTENENGLSAGTYRAATLKTTVDLRSHITMPQFLQSAIVPNDKPISSACTGDYGGGVFMKKNNQDVLLGFMVGLSPPRETISGTCGGQTIIVHLGNVKEWLVKAIDTLRAREIVR